MNLTLLGSLLGGIGLFLLGMRLMTEGLKLAAGTALRTFLTRSTSTTLRGVMSGATITAIAQSSSAVTVATIGFVNAGLIGLAPAILVVYGSNVGTTATGWIVTLVGLDFDVKALALPLLGGGMLLRVFAGERRSGAVGEALAGFGAFFLGIDVLKTGFAGLGAHVSLSGVGGGLIGTAVFVGLGFLLTLLMQSSSAALTVTLSAAAGGVITLPDAAAVVIGANVGTTSTAGIAVVGATPNAKRVAAAHVLFNLITGLVAIALLPLLLTGLSVLRERLRLDTETVAVLALFHTTFNVLGVLMMAPLAGRLAAFLERRFRTAEEDESRPRYLDRNVVHTPPLALQALFNELARAGSIVRRMAASAISAERADPGRLLAERRSLDVLVDAIGEFSAVLERNHLPAELSGQLPNAFRVLGHYTAAADHAAEIAAEQHTMTALTDDALRMAEAEYKRAAVRLIGGAAAEDPKYAGSECRAQVEELGTRYRELKSQLLRAAAADQLPTRQLVEHLDMLRGIRHVGEQVEKAARRLAELQGHAVEAPVAEGGQAGAEAAG